MFYIRWIFRNIDSKHRALFITGVIISVVVSCTVLINPYLTSLLVDNVIIGENVEPLIPLLATMLTVQVVRLGLRYSMQIMFEKASQQMIYTLRRRLFKTLQHQENSFFNRNRTGDLMTRMTGDLDVCRHFVCNLTHQTIDTVLLFTSTLIFLLIINWQLTLALLAVTPMLMIVTYMYSKKARPHFIKMRERLTEMNIAAQENIAGNRIVKAFARETYESEKFEQRNRNFRDANLGVTQLWLKFYPVIEILANFMTLITILIGGIFMINDTLTAGELAIFTSMTWALANPMRSLGTLINDYQRFFTSANKVVEIFYSRPLIVNRLDAVTQDAPKGYIKFNKVGLKFGNKTILDDVSFEVKPGRTLAIIGPTGSGKTMIINLLTRLYDVTSGEVLLDECNVRQWRLEQLRGSIGVATQDIFLFSDTIEGNIAFGDQQLTESEV
ncbi:MAG: ABC transporter transmembrane domain-containing protein, partial [Oscillospiraceae bacterium]|nr:ABC transporter transmembrane domain-containing protein [Oscillospiraceae bacterium]